MLPSRPELLGAAHDLSGFDCGKAPLNEWLRTHALSNQAKGFTRVVVVHAGMRVVGFYGLAPTAVPPNLLSRAVRTGRFPDPVPCILLGQMAVDNAWKGRGVGGGLLKDALKRCLAGAAAIGGRALVVRAIDVDAERYWVARGFISARGDPSTLFRPIYELRSWLERLSV